MMLLSQDVKGQINVFTIDYKLHYKTKLEYRIQASLSVCDINKKEVAKS